LRSLRGDDAAFVSQLSAEAFSEFAPDARRSTLWLAEHHPTLVVERSGDRVGFCVVRSAQRHPAELIAIAVRERERGRGIGRALLAGAERLARAAGSTGLVLHTAEANLAALDLFMKSGFRVTRKLPGYYLRVFDAVEMLKEF
jgi:ribosomal protein S18 acetylase RimI-like enzyme